jgi:ribosomal protein S18 acetylase RimI-like enzyme
MGAHVLEIRRVRADEWREYRTLRLEALHDSPLSFGSRYEVERLRPDDFWIGRAERAAAGDSIVTYVAEVGGAFVGMAACALEEDGSAEVVSVYVTPLWRGRERVAERLVLSGMAWAFEEKRVETIRLHVTEINDRAIAFYRRLGFVETGDTIPYDPQPPLVEREMVFLRRS